jgi:hypothetical protein
MDEPTYRFWSAVGSIATAVGIVLTPLVAAGIAILATRLEARRGDERARRERLRDWNVRRIEQTRTQLAGLLDGLLDLVSGSATSQTVVAMNEKSRDYLLASFSLVGDVAAIRQALEIAAALMDKMPPPGPLRRVRTGLRMTLSSPFTASDRAAIDEARAALVQALNTQQERALRDEDIIVVVNRPGFDGGSASWRKMESCQRTQPATTARIAIQLN